MKKVEFVQKDGKLGYGQNTFTIVTHDKVVETVRQHFKDAGVIVIPHQVEKGISVPGVTKNGAAKIRFEAVYDVDFIDVDDGSKVTIRSEAHAEDNSDKAANKALTYAVKNALLKVLMLQTGDDQAQEGVNKINAKQATMLKGLMTSTESDEAIFLTTYGAESYDDFPQAHFANAVDILQKKLAKAKK
jgi:hypothetical protein